MKSSFHRIKTLTTYYLQTTIRNPTKMFLMLVWPIVDLFIWGYTIFYIQKVNLTNSSLPLLILEALVIWSLLTRAQQEISHQFMEDVFSRNFNNILITPVNFREIFFALIFSSVVKLFLVLSLLFVVSFLLFALNIFQLGFWFLPFLANLIIFGWILGIVVVSVILRFGYRFDFLAWSLSFFIWPFSCVFYSRNNLPYLMKITSFLLPSSYIFEAMREVFLEKKLTMTNLHLAIFLNLLYLLFAYLFFLFMFKWAKRSGSLAKI